MKAVRLQVRAWGNMSLAEYGRRVREHAARRDGHPIFDNSIEHASIVIESLFLEAERSVAVLSGNLIAKICGRDSVVEAAKLFLVSSAKNRLRIILESVAPEDREIHPFFRGCSELRGFAVRVASPPVQRLYDFHFVLADDDSYRFEGDKAKAAAIAAFGHVEGAQNLEGIHEHVWDQCEPVDIGVRVS